MSNSSRIDDLVLFLPAEIQAEIRDRFLQNRARSIIRKCQRLLRRPSTSWSSPQRDFVYTWPNMEFPYYSSLMSVPLYRWTSLWYLLNTYHMPIVFQPHLYRTWDKWQYYDYTLFDKFWFEVFGDNWRVVASGQSSVHPLNEPIERDVLLIAKFNSNKPLLENGLHCSTQFEWIRNADGSLHGHNPENLLNITCQTAIWRASELNTRIEYNSEDIATSPEAYLASITN